ncbi:TetR/AcrR family transcriptional regulator [Verticiella sediminum]|uniref:TetR/AcrR family transcriptional regulator n=1 Tax=Verticiella sediminum TaxID=1247510 RepID=A0A556AV55_9BURK|nr:TetR/AcrR family transcriptional regulator [Verticiella sediminum]TSH96822.1 TetR/AcrR family transcriptional regulator [Verticiella sediminum]
MSTGNKRDAVAHAAVLKAASDLLNERGPHGLSMEAVARLSGVSKPTIYRWWPDKTALLLELFNKEILPVPEIPEHADLATELKLRMHALFQAWRETPAGRVFRGLVIEMQSTPEMIEEFRKEALAPRRRQSVRAFQRAIDRGDLAAGVNVEGLLDLLYGWAWYRLLTGQLTPDAEFEVALDCIARGAASLKACA